MLIVNVLVAGLDEVGRGSIAGPLLVVAAMFEVEDWTWRANMKWVPATPCPVTGVKDSKAFSSRTRRAAVAATIKAQETLVGHGRGIVTSTDITKYGMSWAIKNAFKRAVASLPSKPDLLLTDGEQPVDWDGKQFCQPKADARWWPVSAASVLAKVERDDWMVALDKIYPGYGWEQNAGYGTPAHYDALRSQGITPVHRASFVKAGMKTYLKGTPSDGSPAS